MADRQRILALLELGWSLRRIERETGVRRETVARHARLARSKAANLIAGSGDDPAGYVGVAGQMRPNPIAGPMSACEPFRGLIEAGVGHGLTAQRIWQDLCAEHGFSHGYLSVQRFVRGIRRRRPEVADVMEHPPGAEAQVDYFQSPALVLNPATGKWARPWIFRMTLSCSRHGYEEPMWRQEAHGFLRAHEHAFLAFGGVPKVVRHDNLKAAVVRACLYDPDVNVLYESFSKHWGFVPLPSRPRHPEENGVQERSGGYVKSNALQGRRFDSLDELTAYLQHWNRSVAQLRIHGTTRRQVITDFLERERPALQALPGERFALFEVGTRTVHADGHVEVVGAFYSVTHTLVGKRVRVHWDEHLVRVFDGTTLLAVHSRKEAATWSTRAEDRPAHKPARTEAYEQHLLTRCECIGPRALAWASEAVRVREVRSYRLLQGIVSLTRKHPRERVDWACGVALGARSFRYRTVQRLVEQAAANAGALVQLTQQHELIRPLDSYGSLA
ncbi:IS21 family transposase [Candidatus Aeolococcus gillhamiae]